MGNAILDLKEIQATCLSDVDEANASAEEDDALLIEIAHHVLETMTFHC
jgi:hypothetical protein